LQDDSNAEMMEWFFFNFSFAVILHILVFTSTWERLDITSEAGDVNRSTW